MKKFSSHFAALRDEREMADLNTQTEQIKATHIEALQAADVRSRNLERAKADGEHSLKSEINCLSKQLAICERSNTPMSVMTRSLPGAGSTNWRGGEHDDSSERLESIHTTPQRGRHDQRTIAGSSLVHS